MIFGTSNVLGIALTDRVIGVAQVDGSRIVQRTAAFPIPPDLSFDKPQELGEALSSFLKREGFVGSHAIVGVPARWVLAVEKDVPPAGREQFKSMLRMQAERLPLADNGELVFDYAGEHDYTQQGRVLLVAMLKRQLDKVMQAMEAAGLTVNAVTATSLALASASAELAKGGGDFPMVVLGRQGAEVVWQRKGSARMLRHFSVSVTNGHDTPAIGALGTELRRAVTLGPAGGASANGDRELVLWDAVGLDDSQIAELSEKVGIKVRAEDGLEMLGAKTASLIVPSGDNAPRRFASPVALAIAGSRRSLLPLNFTKSRLAAPKKRVVGRKSILTGVVVTLAIIGIAALFIDKHLKEGQLAEVKDQQAARAPETRAAQAIKDKVDYSGLFFNQRGPILECLRELTLMYRDNDDMWTTGVTFREDRDNKEIGRVDGIIDGKAGNSVIVYALGDRLTANPRFSSVVVSKLGTAGARGGQQAMSTFTITFTFRSASMQAQQPANTAGTPASNRGGTNR